ncbi:MAG TPA: tetratricopeptide repeat protein [Candidatus Methylomirabilis sp.]|nr:tetratricopeptide repeat protein [Candidatus Methylomirabilis sp.]
MGQCLPTKVGSGTGDRAVRAAAVGLILLLGVGFAAASADQTMTREQALAALADKNNVETRRLGAARLGDLGQMQDVPFLVEALRDPDALVGMLADQSLWQIWGRSGDPEVDAMFQHGVDQMSQQDYSEAVETFSQIIQKKPDFAEGWNKRATIYYLLGEYTKSLADCEEVIRRNPVHFGALSGFGLNYLRLGKPEQALDYFERALAVNPNLAQIQAAVEELKKILTQRRRDSI